MKNRSRLTALLLALLMFMSALPVPALADDVITTMDDYQDAMQRLKDALNEPSIPQEQENAYTITRSAQIDAIVHETITGVIAEDGDNTFTLPVAGKLMLSTAEAAEAYQWQISADGVWANIVGDSAAEIALTYAKIQNALSGGAAIVRCALTRGGEVSYSPEAIVAVDMTPKTETTTVEETIPAVSFYAPAAQSQARALNADALANEDERTTYDIVINYLLDNEVASDPYTANLAAGESFSTTVTFPIIQGYLPYVGEEQRNSIDLNYPAISEDVTINVVYKPTNVNYTVIHYQQNVGDDNYTEAERETKQGLTKSTVPEVKKSYDGFYALPYEKPEIAADGSTVIEIYYDRSYYLINFDLDGGYGVEPIYARYGATIGEIGTPVKAGYTFAGWASQKGSTETEELPSTVPAENKDYYAVWTPNDTAKVTIVIWGENADDEEHSYMESSAVNVKPGTEFTYSENGTLICEKEKHTHTDACGVKCGHSHTAECYGGTTKQDPIDDKTNSAKENIAQFKNLTGGVLENGKIYRVRCNAGESIGSSTKYDKYYLYFNGTWYLASAAACDGAAIKESKNVNAHGHTGYIVSGTDKDHYWVYNAKLSCTHTHTDSCYACGKTEHTHTSACYMGGSKMDAALWKFVKSDNVTVAADGSSVVNVYYDRVEYSVQFYKNQNCSADWEYADLRITAKWGQSILSKWPTYEGSSSWYVQDKSDTWQNSIQTMPVGGAKFWGPKEGNNSYKASYYVEVLPGEDGTPYHGVTYKLHHQDVSVSSGNVSDEERYEIKGFTYKEGTDNGSSYNNAKFYYTRNTYALTFNDGYRNVRAEEVKYEAPLSTYKDYVPDVPSEYEAGSVKFGGWYLNPECTGKEYKLDEHNMPAGNVLLYAKWVPVTHTVRFYLTEASTNVYRPEGATEKASFTVAHGGNIAKEYVDKNLTKEAMNTVKPNGDYTFVVWYWYDKESHQKHYFDPTTPIRRDMDLYGEWSSNTLKQYTVKYVLKDNPDTKVADDLTGSGLAGTTKTFDAKGGLELYADYQEGYFPTVKSQSLMLDINSDNLAIIFEYVQKEAVPYTVKYINTETNRSVFDGVPIPDKVVGDNRKAVVTETFLPIQGFMPDAYQKRLVVTAGGENILYFYYTKDTTHAYYKITHYTENLGTDAAGNTTWTEYASSQAVGDIGTTYTADPMTIPGFTYDSSVEGTLVRGELTANGLELKLYYTRNSYPYQVRYLEQGTGKELAAPKNATDKYGQVISESAIEIANYDAVAPTSQILNIRIEESTTEAKLNVITFYYKEKEVAINYVAVGPDNKPLTETELTTIGSVAPPSESVKLITGTAQGSTATLIGGPTYRFVGWFKDAACMQPVDADWVKDNKLTPGKTKNYGTETTPAMGYEAATYYAKFEYNLTTLTITKSGAAVNEDGTGLDAGQSFLFKVTGEGLPEDGLLIAIKGNGSETISGLTVGETYTVTEVESWSWRYTATPVSKQLKADASENVVTVTNTRDKAQWLDGDCYEENDFRAVSSQIN